MSEACFSKFFPHEFLYRFLLNFWRLEIEKIVIVPRQEHDFCKIRVFEKTNREKFDFGIIFGRQNEENSKKNILRKYVFSTFQHKKFAVLLNFGSIWGFQNRLKIVNVSKTNGGTKASSEALLL